MASQAKLTLRAPPHVEFVQGYPGIPPQLPDRPPAAVKGELEIRFTVPLKAKWVRVELRKIETLPGGGPANSYAEHIGESPLTVWQAKGEWDELITHDFPFHIRIPETVPPSITLDRGAGIRYELMASVFVKGKAGLFRREATPTVTASETIVIEKHELHSTWPIYAQPESRSRTVDGYTLIINRTHTCYAPGDRIAVQTILKNDTRLTNHVKHYEFALVELIIFRPGAQGGAKKSGPQARRTPIQEQRIPITITSPLHPGMQAKAELSLQVPVQHATPSVSWGQRIEISYIIHVKAVLANNQSLSLDLPVTMSSWPRAHSADAIRRIGTAPNLSGPAIMSPQGRMIQEANNARYYQLQQQQLQAQMMQVPQQRQMTNDWAPPRSDAVVPNGFQGQTPAGYPGGFAVNTAKPGFGNTLSYPSNGPASEFGGSWAGKQSTLSGSEPRAGLDDFGAGAQQRPLTIGALPSQYSSSIVNGGSQSGHTTGGPVHSGGGSVTGSDDDRRRKGMSRAPPSAGRGFAVVNVDEERSGTNTPRSIYPTAEEEKGRLRASDRPSTSPQVAASGSTSQVAARPSTSPNPAQPPPALTPPIPTNPTPAPAPAQAGPVPAQALAPSSAAPPSFSSSAGGSSQSQAQPKPWISAEEEKRRLAQQRGLYEQARAEAARVQEHMKAPSSNDSSHNSGPQAYPIDVAPSRSDFRAEADVGGSSSRPAPSQSPQARTWLSAAEEKTRMAAQMRLYEDARAATEKAQNYGAPSSAPTYDAPTPPPADYPNPYVQAEARPPAAPAPAAAPAPNLTAAQALYQRAQSQMRPISMSPAVQPQYGDYSSPPTNGMSQAPPQQYPTAQEEKAAMRYKMAMEAAQNYRPDQSSGSSAPVAYDALFPATSAASSSPSWAQPPPNVPVVPIQPLSVDRSRSPPQASPPPPAVEYAQPGATPSNSAWDSAPPLPQNTSDRGFVPTDARAEKEQLRKLFQQQDAPPNGSSSGAGLPSPPSFFTNAPAPASSRDLPARQNSLTAVSPSSPPGYAPASNGYSPRPPPTLPTVPNGNSNRPLTAAEEKEMLRARYLNNEDVSGPNAGSSANAPGFAQSGYFSNLHQVDTSARNLTVSSSPPHFAITPPPLPQVTPSPSLTRSPPFDQSPGYEGESRDRSSYAEQANRDPSISLGKRKEAAPPPLAPRPPADYYQYDEHHPPSPLNDDLATDSGYAWNSPSTGFDSIQAAPFAPFDGNRFASQEQSFVAPPPPPPLPPKVPL